MLIQKLIKNYSNAENFPDKNNINNHTDSF